MNMANFWMSATASMPVAASVFVASFGVGANRHVGVSSRSDGNSSLLMPCSTL